MYIPARIVDTLAVIAHAAAADATPFARCLIGRVARVAAERRST